MKPLLSYADNVDQELYLQTKFSLGTKSIQLISGTIASTPEKPNEDAFAAAYDTDMLFAAVFDGTTSLKPIKSLGEQTGARFASHFLKNTFAATKSTISPKDLLTELNKQLLKKTGTFEEASIEDTHTLPSSTGTIIKIDIVKNTFSFAHVGDSYGIVYYTDGTSTLFTDDKNGKFDKSMFSVIARIAKEKHISPRVARDDQEVKEALIAMFIKRNNSPDGKGSGIINGDPQIEQYIQTQTFSLHDIKAILLGTDGLTPLGWSEKKEEDRQKLLEEITNGGFEKLFKTKKQSEDADPDWNHIRYKHSDDGTGIVIKLK